MSFFPKNRYPLFTISDTHIFTKCYKYQTSPSAVFSCVTSSLLTGIFKLTYVTFQINKTYLTSNPVVGNFTLAYSPQYSSSPSMNLSNPEVEQQMKNISYVDIFIDGGHQLQETVLSCSWNKNVHLCNETFTPVNSDTYGYCYTFNAKGSTISEKPGNLYGLELVIYVGQEWYGHYARSDAAGIKVLIHEPSSYPSFQTNSLSVQTGVASEMIISRKQVRNCFILREFIIYFYSNLVLTSTNDHNYICKFPLS